MQIPENDETALPDLETPNSMQFYGNANLFNQCLIEKRGLPVLSQTAERFAAQADLAHQKVP